MENLSGQHIKGYELRERIGAGGFGAVYRANQSTVGREVAVKIILPHFASHPDFIRRFETEAQLVARLEHLHIVPLYDYWRDPDGAYLVMRWLKGGSLRDALNNGPFAPEAAALLLDQISSALAAAHRNNVIHRDLKPGNILLDEDGNAYLADFGIAKDVGGTSSVTEPDAIVGSPDYLAPEQARAEQVTPRTDIYSLGVVLYEILTGEHPFPNLNMVERLYKHLNEPLPEIDALPDDVRQPVNEVIQKATAKNPQNRYADTQEMATAFRAAIKSASSNPVETLTLREQEILRLIIDGHSNKEIAQQLVLTLMTVKWYASQIYRKLGVRNRVQAILRARELNLITKPGSPVEAAPNAIPTDQFQPENPYKGLRAFQSTDHQDFFGREKLVEKLLKRMAETGEGSHFLAVVGPSGSGKSSLVKAGVIPALWRGALPDSQKWFVVEMLPGARPLDELEIALTRVAANQSGNLNEQLRRDPHGLTRAASLILPNDGSELVIVIDQFEEVFTLVEDESERTYFLDLIGTAVTDARSRVRVVITLRADFYDRPLHYPQFGELIRSRMETILPLSAEGLERAIARPAERVGVSFEPGLVATIISEINYQAGALPLLQYALTELFEQRQGRQLTHEAYQTIGRTTGALAKRAEELYRDLTPEAQEAAQQMFLRLVTLGEGVEDTRRRTARSELLAINSDTEIVDEIIDTYAEYRLLSLDNDPGTHTPTVEVAHEAILREWERLRLWLNDSREDIRLQRQLADMTAAWKISQKDASFLLHGSRLETFEKWGKETKLALTPAEHNYLNSSISERERQAALDQERQAREARLERRSSQFLRGLVAVFAIAAVIASGLTVFAFDKEGQAQAARAISDTNAAISHRTALINAAQLARITGNSDLALALAVEANRSSNRSPEAQLMLADAAYTPGTIRRFTEHKGAVTDVAFSPDGQLAATASADASILIWKVDTGEVVHKLRGHTTDVTALAFSPDGRTLISGSGDTTLRLWDVETGQTLRELRGHQDWVNDVAISPDGRTGLSGADNGTVILWDIETGEQIRQFVGHTFWVNTVAYHPDGHRVLTGSWDESLRLWDLETGNLIRTFTTKGGLINRAVFSPDGNTILMASGESADVLVWDTESGELRQRLRGHDGTLLSVAFDRSGRLALSGAWDDTIILWNLATGEILHRFQGHTHGISNLAFSPDGRYALSSSLDGTARLWDLLGAQVIRRFQTQNGETLQWIVRAGYSPDGKSALTSSIDGTSVLWDIATGKELRRFQGRNSIFTSDGSVGIFGIGGWYSPIRPGSLFFFNLTNGELLNQFDFSSGVRDLVPAPDGKTFAVSFANGPVHLIDTVNGQSIRTFAQSDVTGALAFSPDSSVVAGNTDEDKITLWDAHTGSALRVLKGHEGFLEGLVFSPDGKTLLSSSFDSTVVLWDVATGTILHRFTNHSASAFKSVFSPDGKLIASSSADRTLIIWDVQTGAILRRFTDLRTGIYSLSFSPNGDTLLAGYIDGTVELWHIDTTTDLIEWTYANRYVPDLTCGQRELYDIEPLCDDSTALPTS